MQDGTIYSQRARMLDRFIDFARQAMASDPELASVQLGCAQYWCDEAEDAVQYQLLGAIDPVPLGRPCDLPNETQWARAWDPNSDAVWAFGPMCVEEGYVEATGMVDGELKSIYLAVYSPLAIAQRDGDLVRTSWLGALHRPWLDAPDAQSDRDGRPTSALPEPRVLYFAGEEPALYDAVLAGDDGALDVLRDAWTLRGDPRGELCALTGVRPLPARVADLVAEYGRAWLGPLAPVIPLSGALFGPGPFVRKAIVNCDAAAFVAVADAREWGTVEAIEFAPGSHRGLSPRMHRLRAVGPIGQAELPGLVASGVRIEELDYEWEDGSLQRLVETPLALRVLRVRGGALDCSVLARAPWFEALQRIEVWVPYVETEQLSQVIDVMRVLERWVPRALTIGVGVLDCGVRSGWMLVSAGGERRLELVRPDVRLDLAAGLAELAGLPRVPRLLDGDDWLALALGVRSVVPLR